MFEFIIASVGTVAVISIVLIIILRRNKLLDSFIILPIACSSIILCIVFPFTATFIKNITNYLPEPIRIIVFIMTALFVHIVLTILLMVFISSSFMKKLLYSLQTKLTLLWSKALGKIKKTYATIKEKIVAIFTAIKNFKIFGNKDYSSSQENVNNEHQLQSINKAEESSLDECIDKAYVFKDEGNYIQAIQFYMYALDKKPSNDIVFWIILDICSLYKSIGKSDLAIYILEGYSEIYKDVMEDNVRNEIEKNLLVI